ncbi:hypothetical protein TNCV_5080451 [Trichonephila clavipes]|nr:hypothetical protein TNCV_5080451 [Trichonephila clavipes]
MKFWGKRNGPISSRHNHPMPHLKLKHEIGFRVHLFSADFNSADAKKKKRKYFLRFCSWKQKLDYVSKAKKVELRNEKKIGPYPRVILTSEAL